MNKHDPRRDRFMLKGSLARRGYDWWWHSFTGRHKTTGEERAFFIEYFICNPARGGDYPILGQLAENKANGICPSYALVKVGSWGSPSKQIHNFHPISSFSCEEEVLDLRIGECLLTETHMKGSCSVTATEATMHPEYMCDAGSMKWDLRISKKIAYHVGYGASGPARVLNAFEMFWHAEGIKTEYDGEVEFDGESYDILAKTSYGYADKNWGGDFTSPWLWISSCDLKSRVTGNILENSAVEIGGGRPKIFGVALPRKLLGGLYYEGTMYDYNFSKFWTGAHMDFRFEEGNKTNSWFVEASNRDSVMKLTLECVKEEMLWINYEAPDGGKRHNRLWNGGTGTGLIELFRKEQGGLVPIDVIEIGHAGCEYGEYSTN